jgi:hypothetical protein
VILLAFGKLHDTSEIGSYQPTTPTSFGQLLRPLLKHERRYADISRTRLPSCYRERVIGKAMR